MTEKCMVFTPSVDASVPLFERGRSSARRKPVWLLKRDLSLWLLMRGSREGMSRKREWERVGDELDGYFNWFADCCVELLESVFRKWRMGGRNVRARH